MESMDTLLAKASVLIEALPYIRQFHGKTIVVKYGGSAMVDHELKKNVIRDVALLKLVGFRPIIVHGGGKEITRWIDKLGLETRFAGGLRVTDQDTMQVVEMVLGRVNKGLVSMMEKTGLKAVGISGKDGTVLRAEKRFAPDGEDIGYVGSVKEVNPVLLNTLLDNDFIPVICPVGSDDEYHSFNINADDAACAVATELKAEKLVFLSDIEGVFRDPADPSTLIRRMQVSEAREFIKQGLAGGGMLPKLNSCCEAIEAGVGRVHILDGRIEHSLLLEFFTDRGVGTLIVADENED